MPFSDFQGYEKLTRIFRRMVKQDAYHPAYLFHGPPHVGKRKLAEAFSMAIFCNELEDDFCGHCSSCRRMQSGVYPDYRVIEPEGATIKIERCRDVIAEAAMQPYEGKKKIFVLDPAERMKVEAANSLLKVLEEPFPFSLFILITSVPQAILPTIDSRCQKIRFAPHSYELLSQNLCTQFDLDPDAAMTLARISGGRPALAEELATGDFLAERDSVIGALAAISERRELEAFRMAGGFRNRDLAITFLELLISILRDAALLKQAPESENLINHDRRQPILEATADFTSEELLSTWKDAIECSNNIRLNANTQAQIDRVLLHLCPVEEMDSR